MSNTSNAKWNRAFKATQDDSLHKALIRRIANQVTSSKHAIAVSNSILDTGKRKANK